MEEMRVSRKRRDKHLGILFRRQSWEDCSGCTKALCVFASQGFSLPFRYSYYWDCPDKRRYPKRIRAIIREAEQLLSHFPPDVLNSPPEQGETIWEYGPGYCRRGKYRRIAQ
jgi:hypothetical protein